VTNNYVLLVEDNPDEVFIAQRAFRKAQVSHPMIVVSDGQQALDYLFCHNPYDGRTKVEQPSLILLDLKLPYVSGLEVLKQIRSDDSTKQIPVIVLTCSMEETDQIESFRLGANDFIRKPTSMSQFIEIIQQIKTKWLDLSPAN